MTTKRKQPHQQVTAKAELGKPEFIIDEKHTTIYANSVQVQQSLYDFKLTFGMVEGVKNGNPQLRSLQSVILTPQHVKELVRVLAENVAAYERDSMELTLRRAPGQSRIEIENISEEKEQ